ncbi:MAG TPA: histidine--tRNA ligase [Patescibacteria group bacterium]|nr:histidine--tRNA ligase [Patescibacteria group bacterium]
MHLNTKPYKGSRDFYPEEKRLQKYIFNKCRQVVQSYGYEEYDSPIIEPIEIYKAKTGEEIVNEQTYEFHDRGKRHVVIRPEMTPSVSRMVAAKRQELAYPLRWYSIPNLWRYERPQKGRLREHWQLNVDIFGLKSIQAEIELINIINDVFKSFNAEPKTYEIKVNHRGLTDEILKNYLGLKDASAKKLTTLIDKKTKMDINDFIGGVDDILSTEEKAKNVTEQIMTYLASKKLSDLPVSVTKSNSYKELNELIEKLKDQEVVNVKYDPSLMRGLDYYTGCVFEVYDNNPENNRAMLGGGRYDSLVGLFGVEPLPTVGFGWGDVTLINFLKGHHLLEDLSIETDAYVVLIGEVEGKASKVIQKLRQSGINLAVDYSRKKIGDQIKVAAKKGISRVIIIGDEELSSGLFKLKDLNSSKEESLSLEDLIKILKK